MVGEERIFKDWEFLKAGNPLYHPLPIIRNSASKVRPCNNLGDAGIGYAAFCRVAVLVLLAFAELQALVR